MNDAHMECINALHKVAGPKSLAQWECGEYEEGGKTTQSLAR
jgi:hypothetical protein